MPAFSWLKKKPEDGSDEHIEIRLPEDEQKKIDAAAAAASELPGIKQKLGSLDEVMEYIKEQREEKRKAQEEETRKKAAAHRETTDDEVADLLVTDPAAAIRKVTEPQAVALMTIRADNLRREVFEDTEMFPYYTGEIKAEVDKLLQNQNLQAKNDRSVIENCYYSVVGRREKDIKEGKLKSRFASPEGSRGTMGGNKTDADGYEGVQIAGIANDPEVQRIAKLFGIKPEDYAKDLVNSGVQYV